MGLRSNRDGFGAGNPVSGLITTGTEVGMGTSVGGITTSVGATVGKVTVGRDNGVGAESA